jgi:hypothetical protein
MQSNTDPAVGAYAVTPSDSATNNARALYIGVSGDVAVVTRGRTTPVTFKAAPVGILPVQVTQVLSTGTTATNILALD